MRRSEIWSIASLDSLSSTNFRTGLTLGHGSNPAHGDAEPKTVFTQSAEVFALPNIRLIP
jgi:hypothetical protein